ncbi:hypothetical protein P7K49_018199, partial [Saguinus oedipus]
TKCLGSPRAFPCPGVIFAAAAGPPGPRTPPTSRLVHEPPGPSAPLRWRRASQPYAPAPRCLARQALLGLTCAGTEVAATPSPGAAAAAAQGEEGSAGLLAQRPPGAWCCRSRGGGGEAGPQPPAAPGPAPAFSTHSRTCQSASAPGGTCRALARLLDPASASPPAAEPGEPPSSLTSLNPAPPRPPCGEKR